MERANKPRFMSVLNRQENRRAFSLVEMIVVTALTSMLLGVVGSMIYSLHRWDRGFRDRYISRDQSARLAEVLRKDIRNAENVAVGDTGVLEVFSPAGTLTRYEVMPEGCRRESTRAGEQKPRFDFFAVGKSEAIQLERQDQDGSSMIMVTFPLVDTSQRPTTRPPLVVYASLGAQLPAAASISVSD